MQDILSKFIKELISNQENKLSPDYVNNFYRLIGEPYSSKQPDEPYYIQIIIEVPTESELITEHEKYKQFKKSTNRYTFHPENANIPVKAHYHVFPSNSKDELYAVNLDGTAHHKSNRNHQIPKKEADELRSLGVNIQQDNIIESKQWLLNEGSENSCVTFFIIII